MEEEKGGQYKWEYFTIHDIIKEYLKNSIPLEKKEQYHRQLVQNYSDKCKGNFAELQEDGYIHQQLLLHVHAADKMELLGQLLTDLLWMAACCKHGYASTLLDSYSNYHSFVPKEVIYVTVIVRACTRNCHT